MQSLQYGSSLVVLSLCFGELSIQDIRKLKGIEINSAQGCKEVSFYWVKKWKKELQLLGFENHRTCVFVGCVHSDELLPYLLMSERLSGTKKLVLTGSRWYSSSVPQDRKHKKVCCISPLSQHWFLKKRSKVTENIPRLMTVLSPRIINSALQIGL